MNVDSKFIMITNNSVLYNLQNIQKNIQSDSKETVSYRKARDVHIATCKFCFVNILIYFSKEMRFDTILLVGSGGGGTTSSRLERRDRLLD